jgi:hypothetical protein
MGRQPNQPHKTMQNRKPETVSLQSLILRNRLITDEICELLCTKADYFDLNAVKKLQFLRLGSSLIVKISYAKSARKNPVFVVKKDLTGGYSYSTHKETYTFLATIKASGLLDELTEKELYKFQKLEHKEKKHTFGIFCYGD